MRRLAHSFFVLPFFVVLAMGTRVAFCEAAAHAGIDLHHHAGSGAAGCLDDHSHEETGHEGDHSDDRVPCSEECASDLTAAQTPKNPSVDLADPTGPPPAWNEPEAISSEEPRDDGKAVASQPPDRLPALFSRAFTGRYLV